MALISAISINGFEGVSKKRKRVVGFIALFHALAQEFGT
jgi:hypothetical protein